VVSGSRLLRVVPDEPTGIRFGDVPAWGDTAWDVAEGCRLAFSDRRSLTVGLEEELILLEPTSLDPVDEIEEALLRLEDDRFTCELRSAQLEVVTQPCVTVSDACREVSVARSFAVDRMAGLARIAAAGVHPTSTLPIEITDRERYHRIADESPWSVREGLPSGLHVHVAVPGPTRALAVYNAARSFLPELAALGANSPFLGAADTGLASTRLKLNETFPRSGIPPAFRTWNDYGDFVAWGMSTGYFPDPSYLWWDLRPHPVHGTLEFRIADAQTRVEEVGALAAVCQALVAWLVSRFDSGEELPVHDTEMITENRRRGVCDGLGGALADLDLGIPLATRTRLGNLLGILEPFAEALGARNELLAAWTLLAENGAERQRRVAYTHGLDEVVRRLADETESAGAGALRVSAAGGRL
jgi:glutamate---cysteine ligase / carboxylate-amine ligase